VTVFPIDIDQGSSNVLGEDHISYCKTVRGPEIFIDVFSIFVTFQINTFIAGRGAENLDIDYEE